jgi:hypothetical protein
MNGTEYHSREHHSVKLLASPFVSSSDRFHSVPPVFHGQGRDDSIGVNALQLGQVTAPDWDKESRVSTV